MKYLVTRTTVETQSVVDIESPDVALAEALDYSNQYNWNTNMAYSVEEV